MSNDAQELVDEISTSTETSNGGQELVDKWVVEIEGRLENPDNSRATRENYPSIFGNWKCWDDFGASFIPETQKWIFVASMTHYFGLNVRSYLLYMQEKVDLAWSYYGGVYDQFRTAENSKYFIEYLLVYSSFLIFSMILLSGEKELKDSWFEIVNNKDHPKGLSFNDIQSIIDFIELDKTKIWCYMLTMKYQIPWFVVEAIYTKHSNLSTKFSDYPITKIGYLFCRSFNLFSLEKFDGGDTIPEGGFKHLLHIFHWSSIPNGKYVVDTSGTTMLVANFHIPSASELQLSQTAFIKDRGGSIDVSYGRISGVMQLTPWSLYHISTKLYESFLIFEENYVGVARPFTAYVACLACLLKTEADVKILRENDIISNTTFDDKNVLCCVQELKTLITDTHYIPNELMILKEEVMAHHKKSLYRLYGEFKKRYCSNTWIIISVIAGILLFVLTFIQTLYGTLSYYKQ